MRFIPILLASITLLTLSLNAQTRDMNLTHRHADKPADYFKSNIQRKWLSTMQLASEKKGAPAVDRYLTYDVTQLKIKLHIPKGFRNNKKWGLLVHINSGNNAPLPKDWLPVLQKYNLVYAAPYQVGNGVASVQRVAAALDTVATLKKKMKFDEKRIYISGLSGGGAMASFTGIHYSEVFTGIIVHARNVMLEPVPISKEAFSRIPTKQKWQKGMVWPKEHRHLNDADIATFAKLKYPTVFITGEKDYNYEPILRSAAGYEKHKLPMKIVDVPGMGHTTGNGKALEAALYYFTKGKRVDKFKPRYKERNITAPKAKK